MSETDSRGRRKKNFEPDMPETWHGPCLQWHGRAMTCQTNPTTSVSWHGPCAQWHGRARPKPTKTLFFPFFLHHPSTTTSLSKTSITTNLQTFTSPSNPHQIPQFLHQNNSLHPPKHNSPIKTNFHPSPPKITQNPIFH